VDGDAKVFKVTFRPRSSAVTALPALPLPYYDPWKQAYAVALSSPIPLTVHDVKTVRTEDSVGAPGPIAGKTGPAPPARIAARVGIGANYRTLDAGKSRLAARPPLFTGSFLLLLFLPPVLLGAAWIAAALRRRPKGLPRGSPLSAAAAALRRAKTPDAAGVAVAEYLRRRLELPPGEVTRKELARALTARVIAPQVAARLLTHWEALEQARFARGAEVPAGIEETIRELDRCLD